MDPLAGRIGTLYRYRTAPCWWFEARLVDPNAWLLPPERRPRFVPAVVVAGRTTDRSWWGRGPAASMPDVLVTSDAEYLRNLDAGDAFDPPPGVERLERLLAGRAVRAALGNHLRGGPGSPELVVDDLLFGLTDDVIARAVVVADDTAAVTLALPVPSWVPDVSTATLSVRRDGSGWTLSGAAYAVGLRLTYGEMPQPPPVPTGDDVVEPADLVDRLGLRRVPSKPTPTSPDVDPPDHGDDTWTVRHDALHELLGTRHCVEAQDLVVEALRRRRGALLDRLEFDSEGSLFVAYARSRRDAVALRAVVDGLITRRAAGPSSGR